MRRCNITSGTIWVRMHQIDASVVYIKILATRHPFHVGLVKSASRIESLMKNHTAYLKSLVIRNDSGDLDAVTFANNLEYRHCSVTGTFIVRATWCSVNKEYRSCRNLQPSLKQTPSTHVTSGSNAKTDRGSLAIAMFGIATRSTLVILMHHCVTLKTTVSTTNPTNNRTDFEGVIHHESNRSQSNDRLRDHRCSRRRTCILVDHQS